MDFPQISFNFQLVFQTGNFCVAGKWNHFKWRWRSKQKFDEILDESWILDALNFYSLELVQTHVFRIQWCEIIIDRWFFRSRTLHSFNCLHANISNINVYIFFSNFKMLSTLLHIYYLLSTNKTRKHTLEGQNFFLSRNRLLKSNKTN